ncbi:MAG TPA: DUF4838 domain-containing protein [Polyangiaceae bacterium]
MTIEKQSSKAGFAGAVCSALLFAGCSASDAAPAAPGEANVTTVSHAVVGPVVIASGGVAMLRIVTKPNPHPEVLAAATDLRDKLNEITGGSFQLATGSNGSADIAVGIRDDFPPSSEWRFGGTYFGSPTDPTRTEDFVTSTHSQGIVVAASSTKGIKFAVSDLLYRLGHRQFFPGAAWEVVPQSPNLSLNYARTERPSHYDRLLFYGYGNWSDMTEPVLRWRTRNRMGFGIDVDSGDAYPGIISRNLAAFQAHPEYLALVSGQRTAPLRPDGKVNHTAKFCISNPQLRALVVADVVARLATPSLKSVSVNPSDGGGWCECDVCNAAYSSISDRVVSLANEVAVAVQSTYPNQKYLGLYAYNQHAAAPLDVTVNPRVGVRVATKYIPAPAEQLLSQWQAQGAALLGIRDYYSIWSADRDLPGKGRGADIELVRSTIANFHALNGRLFTAEAGGNWGPSGLGYYLASRYLWNTAEATPSKATSFRNDFLQKSFGAAATRMGEFYTLIDGSSSPLLSSHLVNRMYSKLQQALGLVSDAKITRRIYDLALYVRYVELYQSYVYAAAGAPRQSAFETLMRFAYRIRWTEMVHSLGIWRALPFADKSVVFTDPDPGNTLEAWQEPAHPWKSDSPLGEAPYTAAEISEITALIANGIANNPTVPWTPVAFSTDLVPAGQLITQSYTLPAAYASGSYDYARDPHRFYVWVDAPGPVALRGTGGVLGGNDTATFDLFAEENPDTSTPVSSAGVPTDKIEYPLNLSTPFAGLHRVEVQDRSFGARASWPAGTQVVFPVAADDPTPLLHRIYMYFYVPVGTPVVGFYAHNVGEVRDATNTTVQVISSTPNFYSVPVQAGQDGKVWKFYYTASRPILMTVPPYLAVSPSELMLPAEVRLSDFGQ